MKNPLNITCRLVPIWLVLLATLAVSRPNAHAQIAFDHEHAFQGGASDGASPEYGSTLTAAGPMLFGVTTLGGASNSGTLFLTGTNLASVRVLHSFNGYSDINPAGSTNDGAYPYGTPLLAGQMMYGTTSYRGTNGQGILYTISTNGDGFTILHHFGATGDGSAPYGSLILAGSTLYGTTKEGTNGDTVGTIYSIGTDGSNYQVLYAFGPGGDPKGSLILSGTNLYGMTYDGGTNNSGNIFVISTNGSGFKDLHSFTGETNDGAFPSGSVILSGTVLYGMTASGGSNNVGIVFSMNTDGSGFTILHNFSLGEAWAPESDLTISGSTLYGMAQSGGISSILGGGYGSGAVFQINTDGSGYRLLHSFEFPSPETDGGVPYGPLLLLNNELYGMTFLGGSAADKGVIFALNPNALPVITTSNALPVGDLNVAYSEQLAATGGTAPYTWTIASGSLPAGLKFSSTGLISGKATALGTSYFSIKVTDHVGQTATQAFSLSIVPPDPTLAVAITYPTNSQQFSNPSITSIAGTATGSFALYDVRYKLNTLPWLNVYGTTNWNSLIPIFPGTNTVSVFLEDVYGNVSKTNSITYLDVVDAELTVDTNGPGSISPALNGEELLEGATYSMTATATAKGVSFINWTDGSNNIVTNGATIKFSMAANLTLIANFKDTTLPILTITAPKTGTKSSNDLVTVTGTATDNVRVSNVWLLVNGATATNTDVSGTTWSAQVGLMPGTNTITAYAVNTGGNHSTTNSIRVVYILSAPVSVQIVGDGTLKPDYNNAFLAISNHYTMVATPAKGFVFYYWDVYWVAGGLTNGFMTNSSTVSFTMVSNLDLTAYFKDITAPTIIITAPKANEKYSNTVITVTGTASDNVGVTAVGVQLNGTGWVMADGTNSWTTNLMAVIAGTNVVQAYAMDAAGNFSATNTVKFLGELPPDWAPVAIAGSTVLVVPSSGNPVAVSYGTNTFSQTDTNATGDSGTGIYSYQQTATNTADLSLTFDAPLTLSNNTPQDIQLDFTNLNTGTFTNVGSADTGTFAVEPATTLVPTSWSGHTITATSVGSANPTTVKFSGSGITITHSGQSNRTGTFVATDVSPTGAILVVTYTDAADLGNITYLQLTFSSTTKGNFEVNTFDNTGTLLQSDYGTFIF